MKEYYADLHIHIGRTRSGKAVKITGAKNLTLDNILQTANGRKGLDMIGIIDSHSPEILEEIEEAICCGDMKEMAGGGLLYRDTALIPGSEIEVYDQNCQGPIHVLAYFPTIGTMREFSNWMSSHVKNITLSSQRIYCEAKVLQQTVKSMGGLFVPAHVFTPFKSLYGKGVRKSLTEVLDPAMIDAIELGLSSDTDMVKGIRELEQYTFLTNSDAHSLGKIAREYQALALEEPTFAELKKALHKEGGRRVLSNYGLNPLLGKYHETVCADCLVPISEGEACSNCGRNKTVKGVARRIEELSQTPGNKERKRKRPPYIHQVPLDFIPGIGPKTMEKLLGAFGTEMDILHRITVAQLNDVVQEKLALYIEASRKGKLEVVPGGGGRYGKVKDS